MIPLGSFVTVKHSSGPDRVMHYNSYPTAEINGGPAAGFSSGQAQAAMEQLARQELPNGMSFEWTELTYQQIIAGNTAVLIFPLVVLLVFLVLAAQYESLSLPLAVILIMPMVLLSAITGVELTHGDSNIFTQIGLIVLVGLASKNAILIVEFARDQELEGVPPLQAALNAARLRLRPILMTSLAFIMGVVPLVVSTGAGAEMRHAMGIAVFSGMLGVTFFGLMLTPLFYVLVRKLSARAQLRRTPARLRPFSSARRSAMKRVDYTLGNEIPAMNKYFAILLATLLLASCAVGPNYRAPQVAPAVVQECPVDRIRRAIPRGALVAGIRRHRTRRSRAPRACRQSRSALRVRSSPGSPRGIRGEEIRLRTARAAAGRVLALRSSSSLDLGLTASMPKATAWGLMPRGKSISLVMCAVRSRPRGLIWGRSRRTIRTRKSRSRPKWRATTSSCEARRSVSRWRERT